MYLSGNFVAVVVTEKEKKVYLLCNYNVNTEDIGNHVLDFN